MRIVHLVPSLGKGGAERVAVDLANQQHADGHDVAIVAGSKADERLLRNDLNAAVHVEYVSERSGRATRYLAGIFWLARRRLWLGERDVIHAHMTFPSAIATTLYWLRRHSRARRPLIVETYHAVGMPIPRWHRWIHARMAERRDGLILMAEDGYWADFIARRPRLRSQLIPNGLAEPIVRKRYEPGPRAYAEAVQLPVDRALVFGSVGRLVPARRPELYIPVFAAVAKAFGPKVYYLMAGEGPEKEAIAALAAKRGIADQFRLPGLAIDASLPRSLIDLYITVNVGSVTGLSGLEAALAGIPTIAIQLLDDHRLGSEDWIWSSPNLDTVADEAIRLLRDASARAALASKQQAHVRTHHSIATMSAAYDQFYELAARHMK